MHKKDGNKGLAHTDPLASYLTGHKRLALPIILLMLMLLVAPLASATTASVTCANAIIDVGQYQSCNAVLAGYSGSGTFTYNFTVANTLSASPSFMWYVPQYDAYSAGVSTLMALSSKVVLTEGEMFPADFSATGALSYYTPSFSDTQINSIITGEDNNGIQACLTIGGSSQAAASWTTLLGSLAEQNALIANVVNAITTGKQLGTLPYNCIELDAEGTITTGTNGILWTSLADKLKFNITAQNANDLLNDYGCSCGYNNTGGTTGFNWNALVPYINYFDIAAYNGNGDLKNFITKKGLQPGQLRVSWDLLDAVDPAENVFPFAYYVDNVSNDIASGYGISVFNSQALSTAANQVALQAIASNTLLYTYMTHNNIYTAVTTTSNTFTFQVTASDATTNNDIQKAKARITDANGNTISSKYSATFQVNPQLTVTNPTPSSNTLDNGQSILLTASASGGTTPYNYQWYTSSASTCTSPAAIPGANGFIDGTHGASVTYLASPTSNTFYCFGILDSASSPNNVISSLAANIVVNPSLAAPSITPMVVAVDLGQSVLFTVTPFGGTLPYSYQWYQSSMAIEGATSQTYLATPYQALDIAGVWYYPLGASVTDSASTPMTVSGLQSFIVNNALGVPSINPSTPSTVSPGSLITFSTSVSGGTPGYTYEWRISNSVTGVIINTTAYSTSLTSNTFVFLANSLITGNTIVANVMVTDSAYSPESTNSINSGVITVGVLPLYNLVSVSTPSFPVYETSSPTFAFSIYVNNAPAKSANVLLYANANFIGNASTSLGLSSTNTYTIPFIAALVNTDNSPITYNAVLYITSNTGTVINQGVISTTTGNTIWNYLPSVSVSKPSNPANTLVGDNITVNTIIAQVTNIGAAVGSGYLTLGNQILTESLLSQYSYSATAPSFIPSRYNLAMPTYLTAQTYTINSIVQLSYNSQSVYRNVSTTFTTYNESLTACGSPQGYSWNFYNSSNTLELWPQDVFVVGHFGISKNGYASPTILGTSIGFTNPATANVYSTCIYPSWGQFNVSGIMQYSTPNTINSTYQLNQFPISNSLKNINLYLLWDTVPQTFNIYVQNNGTQQYIASQVVVYQYNIATNQSVPISTLAVPAGHSATIVLQIGDVYIFQAFGPSGSPLYATSPQFTASGCGSSTCNYVIQVTGAPVTNPPSPVPDVGAQNCIVSLNTPTTNAVTLSCSWHSGSGASYNISLLSYKSAQAGIGPALCTSTLVASAGSVQCVFYNTTTNQYYWYLTLNNPGYAGTQLKAGVIGVTVNQWGSDGLWVTVLAIIVLATVMLTKSIGVSVILFDIGFTVFNLLGFIKAPFPVSEGFLYVVSAVLLYLINRHD